MVTNLEASKCQYFNYEKLDGKSCDVSHDYNIEFYQKLMRDKTDVSAQHLTINVTFLSDTGWTWGNIIIMLFSQLLYFNYCYKKQFLSNSVSYQCY